MKTLASFTVGFLSALLLMLSHPANASISYAAISAGHRHTCALTTTGTVKCWGFNMNGELGDGTTINRLIPVTVTGLSGVTAISSGSSHTCALTTTGNVKCWGNNWSGQLGDGTTINRLIPVAVTGLSGVMAISAGGDNTCALTDYGTVQCWGGNRSGQIGSGSYDDYPHPNPEAVISLSGVTAISAGDGHTCALTTTGTVKCWGSNVYGHLGYGPINSSHTPVTVSGLSGVTAISAGGDNTCALSTADTVKCWGQGQTEDRTPLVTVSGLSGVTAISVGINNQCALTTAGMIQCWRYTIWSFQETPASVTDLSNDIVALSMPVLHTCALTNSGTVQCWGNNVYGELGDGTTTYRPAPVDVFGEAALLAHQAELTSLLAGNESILAQYEGLKESANNALAQAAQAGLTYESFNTQLAVTQTLYSLQKNAGASKNDLKVLVKQQKVIRKQLKGILKSQKNYLKQAKAFEKKASKLAKKKNLSASAIALSQQIAIEQASLNSM